MHELESNRRILVIDDSHGIHEDFRKVLMGGQRTDPFLDSEEELLFGGCVRALRPEGSYAVDFAENGRAGLEMVIQAIEANQPYAMTFVDMHMPGWNGIETIKELWQVDDALQVVICTGCLDLDWKRSITKLGQSDQLLLLKKPFDAEEVSRLASALTTKWIMTQRARMRMDALEETVSEKTREIRVAHEDTIHRLVTASMYRDRETGAHIRRTGLYAELMASRVGWSAERVESIRMAAPMHDVGKIGIPDSILQKPGRLTRAEFEIMKSHTVIGEQMLRDSLSPILQAGSEIALSHHERWDGSGYPFGAKGTDIPLSGRITAIVDVYDALSHDRVYRKALPHARVVTMLKEGSGTHFDPQLLDLFLTLLPEMSEIAAKHPDPVDPVPDELSEAVLNTHSLNGPAGWFEPADEYCSTVLG